VKRAHGLQGEVRAASSTDNPERFAPGEVMYAFPPDGGERRRLEIEVVRGTWDSLIVGFVGVGTREEAEALRGSALQVAAASLPELEDEEYYPFDLEGLEVHSRADGGTVGRVQEVLETPAHEILVVRLAPGAEVLVPFTFEAIPEVHVSAGYVVVEDRFLRGPEESSARADVEDTEPA
jgi:16S rRNA processing protein RimM